MSTYTGNYPFAAGEGKLCVDSLSIGDLKRYNKKYLKKKYETITAMNACMVRRSLLVEYPDKFFKIPKPFM